MVNKNSLDEKLKEKEKADTINEIENARRFIKFFINLMEGILNYEYDELSSYFEEDKTIAEIELTKNRYELTCAGMKDCYIKARVKLHREDYAGTKLKVINLRIDDKFFIYELDIDKFLYNSLEDDDKFITDYIRAIRSNVFKDFVYDWSYNKDKIFKRVIRGKNITPSQWIIECINNYVYDNFIKPKSTMKRDDFKNSEFKFDVDETTQKIFDRHFFENI